MESIEAKELNKFVKVLAIIGIIVAVLVLLFVIIYGTIIAVKYPRAEKLCREEVIYCFDEENDNDIVKIESESCEVDLSKYDNLGKYDKVDLYEYIISYKKDGLTIKETWYAEIYCKVNWLAKGAVIEVYDLDVFKKS